MLCRLNIIGLLSIVALSLYAQPRSDETATVVGAVIIDLVGSYEKYERPVTTDLLVRVAGQFFDRRKQGPVQPIKVITDRNGYWKIDNVPAGNFLLKGIEVNIGNSVHITLISHYDKQSQQNRRRYWGMVHGMMYRHERYLIENQLEGPRSTGMVDLGIQYIKIRVDLERSQPFFEFSPDGLPPWRRMSMKAGHEIISLEIIEHKRFREIDRMPMGNSRVQITKVPPQEYFR